MPAAGANLEESKKALKESVAFFLDHYKKNPNANALHNIYGELNYQEWLVMNIKHVRHHFAQFGVEVEE
jgi:oxepin-CoA hydrolase/3-oxo-5,6-dehydrosuberyl-CoA semialdehyde dehydrogenase